MQVPDFDVLYVRHGSYVQNLLRNFGVARGDMDDAAQDSFERVHRLLSGFEGRAKIETWLYAICYRVAAEYRRRVVRERAGLPLEMSAPAMSEDSDRGLLQASLDTLDSSERDLLVLHEIGELTVSGLAELTGGARTTIRRRLEKARVAVERGVERARSVTAPLRAPQDFVAEQAVAELARDADDREHICADYGFTRCGDLVLLAWEATPRLKDLAIEAKIVIKAADDAREVFTYLCVIEPSSAPPDARGREILAWILATVGPRCAAAAYVTPGAGVHAVVPPILNSVSFLARDRVNARFFHDVRAALAWLVPHTPGGCYETALAEYERMRARMRECPRQDAPPHKAGASTR